MKAYSTGALVLCLSLGLPAAGEERWAPLGLEGGEVLSLLSHPQETATLYAGTLGGGIFVSRDGGETWGSAGDGLLASWVRDLAMPPGPDAPLYAATDAGVFRLAAQESRWTDRSHGIPPGRSVDALVVDPAQPQRLLAAVSDGVFTSSWTLYHSTNGGER